MCRETEEGLRRTGLSSAASFIETMFTAAFEIASVEKEVSACTEEKRERDAQVATWGICETALPRLPAKLETMIICFLVPLRRRGRVALTTQMAA
jgi:hypothetical protein